MTCTFKNRPNENKQKITQCLFLKSQKSTKKVLW